MVPVYVAMHKNVEKRGAPGQVVAMENRKIFEAIALRKCIDANYNRGALRLAPYILYTRHGELFVDGVTVNRGGQPPREIKIGTFKLSGLTEIMVTDVAFRVEPILDYRKPAYVGATLFAVDAEEATNMVASAA